MPQAIPLSEFRDQYAKGMPFVLYKKPNQFLTKGLLQADDAIVATTAYTETGFVFAPFDHKNDAVLFSGTPASVIMPEPEEVSTQTPLPAPKDAKSYARHIRLIEQGLTAIKESALQKVVLSRQQIVNLNDKDPFIIFERLTQDHPSAFVYLWFHPLVGTWLGATPERLLRLQGPQLKTMALAGTQPYDAERPPVWRNKEDEEQALVTSDIEDRLNQLEGAVVSRGERINHRAGKMMHLLTPISARFTGATISLKKIIDALHPTPAVCGLPRALAYRFIMENEMYDREFYTGFLGEINVQQSPQRKSHTRNVENRAYVQAQQQSDLFVNLRCMQLNGDTVSIYVGGGITSQSIPEEEWQETVNKTQTMRQVLEGC